MKRIVLIVVLIALQIGGALAFGLDRLGIGHGKAGASSQAGPAGGGGGGCSGTGLDFTDACNSQYIGLL